MNYSDSSVGLVFHSFVEFHIGNKNKTLSLDTKEHPMCILLPVLMHVRTCFPSGVRVQQNWSDNQPACWRKQRPHFYARPSFAIRGVS